MHVTVSSFTIHIYIKFEYKILSDNLFMVSGLRINWKWMLPLFLLELLSSSFSGILRCGYGWWLRDYSVEIVPFGEVNVKIYIVALDGVDAKGLGDFDRVLQGIFSACKFNYSQCILELLGHPTYTFGEIKMHISAVKVQNWSMYKEVIEASSNVIIINSHGEVLPVPLGYTKESWTDKIAEAMLTRNVTWVHVAGYPFYYYCRQDGTQGEWREEGFQRLMAHIGKSNITCKHPRERVIINMHIAAEWYLYPWTDKSNAARVQRENSLNASNFKNELILPIWGCEDTYLSGAIIKFAKSADTENFGFYVHIGANQTYTAGTVPTDADYWRGYVGAAAAIWVHAWRFAAEDAIKTAERAISQAEAEGRTKGLEEAKQLLELAKFEYKRTYWTPEPEPLKYRVNVAQHQWGYTILLATEAKDAAEKAAKPSFLEIYALPLTIIGIAVALTATGLAINRKNNSKKKKKKEEIDLKRGD